MEGLQQAIVEDLKERGLGRVSSPPPPGTMSDKWFEQVGDYTLSAAAILIRIATASGEKKRRRRQRRVFEKKRRRQTFRLHQPVFLVEDEQVVHTHIASGKIDGGFFLYDISDRRNTMFYETSEIYRSAKQACGSCH